MLFPGEKEAVDKMLADAAVFGYGNFISHLQKAWQKHLQEKFNLDEEAAKAGSWQILPLYDKIDKLKAENEQLKKRISDLLRKKNT